MIHRLKASFDKLLFALALGAVAASGVWLWRQQDDLRRLRAQPVAVRLAGPPYAPANLKLPETRHMIWPKAPAQSRDPGWLYEVFTPPVIYYDASARVFTVTAPMAQGVLGLPFGLELLAVKPEQFRLQLVGYFGAPDDYLAVFVSPSQPETMLARAGRRFERLGLTLKSFAVRKVPVEQDDLRPVYDVAALAVLVDDQTGAEVVLDSRTRRLTDRSLAVLRPLAGGGLRELREGDTFADEISTYRIERIQLDPPEVVVARTAPGQPQPETKVLHPLPAVAKQDVRSSHFPHRPASELVTNTK